MLRIQVFVIATLGITALALATGQDEVIINDTNRWKGVVRRVIDGDCSPFWWNYWDQTGVNTKSEDSGWSDLVTFSPKSSASGNNTVTKKYTYIINPDLCASIRFKTSPEIDQVLPVVPATGGTVEAIAGWRGAYSWVIPANDDDGIDVNIAGSWTRTVGRTVTDENTTSHSSTTAHNVTVGGEYKKKSWKVSGGYSFIYSNTVEATLRTAITIDYEESQATSVSVTLRSKPVLENQVLRVQYRVLAPIQQAGVMAYPDANSNGLADGPLELFTGKAMSLPEIQYKVIVTDER